jgi:hypothetical protein
MTRRLNAVLGSIVVTVGFWVTWGELPPAIAAALALAVAGFLIWRSPTIGTVWAWTTLLLGVESLSWPVITLIRMRQAGPEPTHEQMGLIFTSLVFGLFAAIFWLTFSYGIFKWVRKKQEREA